MNYTDYNSAIHVFFDWLVGSFKTSLLWKAWYYQLGYTFMRTRFQLSVLTSRYELSGSKKVHIFIVRILSTCFLNYCIIFPCPSTV